MTTVPSDHLRLTTVDAQDRVRIELHGDLEYTNADLLLDEATAQLAARPDLKDLHLHCGGLGVVDSMGLSILLMIARRTSAAGVRLHLDDRTDRLQRLLTLTGTLEYLTSSPAPSAGSADPSGTEDSVQAARPSGPEGIN